MIDRNGGWYIWLDAASLMLSFLAASLVRFASWPSFSGSFGWILLVYLLVLLFGRQEKAIMKRGKWEEMLEIGKINLLMAMLLAMFLYWWRAENHFPRSVYLLFFAFNSYCMYLGRLAFKHLVVRYYRKTEHRKRLIVFANWENVLKVLKKLQDSMLYDYEIIAVAAVRSKEGMPGADQETELNLVRHGENGTYMERSPEEIENFLKRQAVDEALISLPGTPKEVLEKLIGYMETMGINVHVTVNTFGLREKEKRIENFGVYHVLTYSPRVFEAAELILKRALDLAGGFVGAAATILLGLFVAPAILLESPGPLIFKQIRIGKNGRRFSMYKFRSMYMDAEQQKSNLMDQNEMNGLMFKIKDDPRITRVGRFIRKTSIDEFPQFFNVLKGDMSLVGTRPPTEEEFMQYNERHKRRLSLKPGITGLWQVSGRNHIREFEDVVKLDVEYIDNWSIWLDIKIIIQTVFVVVFRKGAS